LSYDACISCGIADDISFELDFISKYNIDCFAYDGTIDDIPSHNSNRLFYIKKNIGDRETDQTTNLLSKINNYNDLFLKMDIEGYEYMWLGQCTQENLNKFKQIVIEFHFPFSSFEFAQQYNPSIEHRLNCLKKLSETHTLIHLHANNCCGTRIFEGVTVPNVFECTYVRKDSCTIIGRNKIPIPHPSLDSKNVNHNPEIRLNGYPFTI
jgi:hypothetical protein